MKTNMKTNSAFNMLSLGILLLSFASCKKDTSTGITSAAENTITETAVAATQAIAVAASRGTSGDSVYVVGTCAAGHHRDSIAFSSLPANVTDYLTANYAGYTFQKAFTDKDSAGNTAGYIVIINYNSKPVGLKFDATGAFVKVLEQREGHDLNGHGWHHGGRFDDRDGNKRDTVAISALPAAITSYFAANYPTDTLIKAYQNRDSSFVVLSKNGGAFATVFDAAAGFVKRVELPAHPGRPNTVELASLPATAQSYLAATYPNYVFKSAFELIQDGAVQGYAVFIDANATKYAVAFDASGNFLKAITVK